MINQTDVIWRFVDSNMTEFPNQEGLNKAFNIYRAAMRKFIISRLRQIPGTNVESVVIDSLEYRRVDEVKRVLAHSDRNIESAIDINDFPHLVRKNWREAFEVQLNDDKTFRNQLWLIVECRNADWAHPPEGDAESEGTRAHLFLIADVLGKINESDAKRVREIRDQLFSDEAEEHPAEVENIAYKEQIEDMTKQLEAAKAEKTELEKQVKTTSDRLEEVEAEWIACDERLANISFQLKTVVAGKTVAEERLSDVSNRFEKVEVEKAELEKRLKTTSDQLKDVKVENAAYKKHIEKLEATNAEKAKPKPTATEKFRAENTLEDRKEIGRKVAELRINSAGSKPMSWARIRAKLGLKNDEFHKVVRLEDHFRESIVERIESFEDGWEYSGKLESLLGFKPVGELANRIEACKPTSKEEAKEEETPEPPVEEPDSISFQGTTFTRDLDKYHVAGNNITQSFWDYWRECKQEMQDTGWSVKKINGVWEVEISLEDFEVWMEEDNKPLTQPTRLPDQKTFLPTGKEMVQPSLEFLSDRGECPRVEIINVLSDHFSLTKNQREKLSRSGKAEVYLRNKGLIERTRTGYYQITDRGLETLHQSGTDRNSVFSNEMHAESQIHPKNTAKSQKSQRKWRRPGAVAALRDPAEIRQAEARIARILNPSEKARLERELRKAKRSVDSS